MQAGGKQLLLIAGAVILTVAIYFAPKTEKKDVNSPKKELYSFDFLNNEAKRQLKRQEVEPINNLEAALAKSPDQVNLYDSLGKLWDKLIMPQIASHYYEEVAIRNPGEKAWINAAFRYYDSFRLTGDSALRKFFVDKAIDSYKKVLEINPSNLDAKTDLGLCYAEGTSSPMEGIKLLREVVTSNPEHEMAQFNLGILSVKSGQYDKAVERFETVLKINPSNNEARFLLGKTYSLIGKNELALENLNVIKNTDDPRLKDEVNNLINQINK